MENNFAQSIAGHSLEEIEQAKARVLCGQPTKHGGACRIVTFGGKCGTHSLDAKALAKRNKKAAKAFRKHEPELFYAQRVAAAKQGYKVTAERHGKDRASEFARQWRLKHPSLLEQWAMDILDTVPIAYMREVEIEYDKRAVDFLLENLLVVEICRHPNTAAKVSWLESRGYKVHVADLTEQDALDQNDKERVEREKIIEFVRINCHPAGQLEPDELPF